MFLRDARFVLGIERHPPVGVRNRGKTGQNKEGYIVESTNSSDDFHRCGGVVKEGNVKGKVHLMLFF